MKKVTIIINTENAAFEDNGWTSETARILRSIADKLENGQEPRKPMDLNGNSVGTIEYE